VSPESQTGLQSKQLVNAKTHMVVAANPYASRAGLKILRRGGNAVDAMVTVQLVLGLVEPQSSGIGGGAFLLYWDAGEKKLLSYDARETAPAGISPTQFMREDGTPIDFMDAVVGGKSVGVPGTPKLLFEVHGKHGKLPWKDVVEPATQLARQGFEVSPRLNALISRSAASLARFKAPREHFFTEEIVPLPAGTLLKNEAYAKTLEAFSMQGDTIFYGGYIGKAIVETVRNAPDTPGDMQLSDLERYEIKERDPVCYDYRGHMICGMGPPSSGGIAVAQILGVAEAFDLPDLGPGDAESWRIIGDASRLAFADRQMYVADDDFVKVPTKGLLEEKYLRGRAQEILRDDAIPAGEVKPGSPSFDKAVLPRGPDLSLELPSTTHFNIVDREGNVVSMTSTIENAFGSRLMTNGFLLNNELTDFSFLPERDGNPVANRIEPGKRPRSSMAPTIVLKNGKPILAVGSPGGSRIIGYVVKTLIAILDWGMDVQEAVELHHLVNRFGPYELEEPVASEKFKSALTEMGFEIYSGQMNSGLHVIAIGENTLKGGADPRREGIALGD